MSEVKRVRFGLTADGEITRILKFADGTEREATAEENASLEREEGVVQKTHQPRSDPPVTIIQVVMDNNEAEQAGSNTGPKNLGGRPPVSIEDKVALLDEYDEGRPCDKWKSQKAFAEHKEMSEGKVSSWLRDARAKREQDPEFGKRSENSPE